MDRKGLLIIITTIAIAVGINYFWLAPNREREVKEYKEKLAKWQADQDAKAAEEAKKNPAQPPPAANTAGQPAALEKPAEPAKPETPAIPEERKNVASEVGTVNYVFTNQGGGISRVILNEHFEDKKKGTRIILNEFG